MDTDQETVQRRARMQWQTLALIGIALALWGSYTAIHAAFDDDTVCFRPLSCVTIDDSSEIWIGLVVTVIGVAAVLKGRRQLSAADQP